MHRPTGSTRAARRLAAGLVAVSLGLLSACGGDDDDGGDTAAATSSSSEAQTSASETSAGGATSSGAEQPAGGTLAVNSVDFDFELDSTELAAGEYTIELTNGGSATHDLVVERDGEDVDGTEQIGPGETSSVTVTLEPGEYVFYCSVGNHRSMGMEVTVTVT
ncbi:cupredoxin domain-containing protein [Blastococcus sp. SYSU D00813]